MAVTRRISIWKSSAYAAAGFLVCLAAMPSARASGASLWVGDRLKITFFETMEIPDPAAPENTTGAAGSTALMQTFYQRVDLTGEYGVEPGGALSLPLLGSINAAGRPIEAVRTDLMESFEKTFGRRGSVNVAIVQRAPIYVIGPVRTSGSFPYSAGMIVMQALALAGGYDHERMQLSHVFEAMRERERREATLDQLKRLLVRRAALVAEREGTAKAQAPMRLRELAGEQGAAALVAAEARMLQLNADARASERAMRVSTVEASRNEVGLMKQRLASFETQMKLRGERLRTMEALYARQVVQNERVADVRRDYVDMEGRHREFEISLLQAEQRLVAAGQQLAKADLARRVSIEKEVVQVDAEIRRLEEALATSHAVISLMMNQACCRGSSGPERQPAPLVFEIVRSGPTGAQILPAKDTDGLEPGDVLRVRADDRAKTSSQERLTRP